jgi:hypothetical protein
MTSYVKRTNVDLGSSRQIRRRSLESRRTAAPPPVRTRGLAAVAEVNTVRLDPRFEVFLR